VIFTALGLLVLGAALLIAGIAKSSVLLLMLSLVSTIAGIAVLALTYSIARRTGVTTGALPTMPAPAAGAPPAQAAGVFMYVPVEQLPAMAPAAAAMKVGGAANGNGSAASAGAPPVAGYDEMTADQVGKLVASGALSETQLQALRDYEADHAGRKTVLDKIDRSLHRA
jgi:hypothetical protein